MEDHYETKKRHYTNKVFTDYYKNDILVKTHKYQIGFGLKWVWYLDGKKHNDHGWAKRFSWLSRVNEYWYKHGKLHRVGQPAVVITDKKSIIELEWHHEGKPHSDTQPALIQHIADKNLDLHEHYWIGDKMYSVDKFRKKVRGPAVYNAMRPLPIPIRDAIWKHYCYQ